jgi:hypothetical protein
MYLILRATKYTKELPKAAEEKQKLFWEGEKNE